MNSSSEMGQSGEATESWRSECASVACANAGQRDTKACSNTAPHASAPNLVNRLRRRARVALKLAEMPLDIWYEIKARQVERYLVMLGYNRAGSTLVGACLNAHPEFVVNIERSVLKDCIGFRRLWGSRGRFVRLILEHDRGRLDTGRSHGGYRYAVANQWQGKHTRLRAVGDKNSVESTESLYTQRDMLSAMRLAPLRILLILRNPYDVIAARHLDFLKERKSIAFQSRRDFNPEPAERPCVGNEALMWFETLSVKLRSVLASFPESDILPVRHEDFVADPKERLRTTVAFYGLDCTDDYLNSCASIVFSSPQQTRRKVRWTDAQIANVAKAIGKYPWLEGYDFDR